MVDSSRKILWHCKDSNQLVEDPFQIIENDDKTFDFLIRNRFVECAIDGGSKTIQFYLQAGANKSTFLFVETRLFNSQGLYHCDRGPSVINEKYKIGNFGMYDKSKNRFQDLLERFNSCVLAEKQCFFNIDGMVLDEERFNWLEKHFGIPSEDNPLTESDILHFKLKWA